VFQRCTVCDACVQAVQKELEERSTAGKLKSFEKVMVEGGREIASVCLFASHVHAVEELARD
jgi:hypothetical protein